MPVIEEESESDKEVIVKRTSKSRRMALDSDEEVIELKTNSLKEARESKLATKLEQRAERQLAKAIEEVK